MKNEQFALPKIIAHRGAPLVAPENTLASLREAKRLGAQWVEFDVCLTRDHQAIIFHDTELSRTTNGRGLVSETSYADIAQLDAGSWFNAAFANERVPTFVKYLQEAAKLNLGINIELKGEAADAPELAKQVADGLKQYWPPHLPQPLISSFSLDCVTAMREQGDNYLLGLILNRWNRKWQTLLEKNRCISLHINYKSLSPKKIKAIKQASYYLLAYTVNDVQLANYLLSQGVDAIFSDNPQLLKSNE